MRSKVQLISSLSIALLRISEGTLRDGIVRVKRPDADWLKSVRAGALTYEEVTALAAEYESHLAEWIEHSPLPLDPDEAAVDQLLIDLQREYLFQQG